MSLDDCGGWSISGPPCGGCETCAIAQGYGDTLPHALHEHAIDVATDALATWRLDGAPKPGAGAAREVVDAVLDALGIEVQK